MGPTTSSACSKSYVVASPSTRRMKASTLPLNPAQPLPALKPTTPSGLAAIAAFGYAALTSAHVQVLAWSHTRGTVTSPTLGLALVIHQPPGAVSGSHVCHVLIGTEFPAR